jgi:hypothetical protein
MANDLQQRFEAALMDTNRRTLTETGYDAKRFLQMFFDIGGLRTAQELIATERVTEGYIAMWERDRLDLTIEALILQPEWHPLFTDTERQTARDRLKKYGFTPK